MPTSIDASIATQTDFLQKVTALVLCGGRSSRMSGIDKGLIELKGKAMIEHTLDQLSPLFNHVVISANQNIGQYAAMGYSVLQDETTNAGPLAGILTAMRQVKSDFLLVTPCDTPLITREISMRLVNAAAASDPAAARIYVAHDGNHLQMLHALFDLADGELEKSLANYLQTDRKVQLWYQAHDIITVDCSDIPRDFTNINTPESLSEITDK